MNDDLKLNFTKEFQTNTVSLKLLSNGIVHYTYLPNSEVDEKEHQINHDAFIEFIGKDNKALVLVDADEFINITSDARKLIRELETVVPLIARALVIKSLSQRILSGFYIKVQKPIIPTKIFNNYKDAIDWLEKFKK